MTDISHLVQTIAIYALPVLFAITLHEAAHGYVARHFGDMTAFAQGRISLNPVRHIDLVGTILVPLVIVALSGGRFLFGWAKPVPVNYSALRRPKQHMMWVAAAGPMSGPTSGPMIANHISCDPRVRVLWLDHSVRPDSVEPRP